MALNIKAERVRLGLSQEEVAENLGIHVNTLRQWESGKSVPNIMNLIKLTDFYKCNSDWLLGLTDERWPVSAITEKRTASAVGRR